MGMAASQTRLLSLTARLSDLELIAQQTTNAKIRLSMSTQELTTEYVDALGTPGETNIASALYNSKMAQVQGQDKIFDLSINQINTEHTA